MTHTDLQSLLNDTAALGRTTTLSRESGLRALLLHLKAGERIPEHQTNGVLTVQCLLGEATFLIGSEPVALKQGSLIGVQPAAPHSVAAERDTLLLVT
jgi:quercetin dioxygenase-like cupin family protein